MKERKQAPTRIQHRTSSPPEAVPWELHDTGADKYDLEERLLEFESLVIDLSESLPRTRAGYHVAGQILRAGTSPCPHHGEAEDAASREDFIHKMKVCLKELRETRRWGTGDRSERVGTGTGAVPRPERSRRVDADILLQRANS